MKKIFPLVLISLFLSIASYAVGPIMGPSSVCTGATVTLTDTPSGGTWSSSNMTVAFISSTTGVVSGISAGVVTITYVSSTGTATKTFTVNASPAAISGPTTVCAGSTVTLTNATPGGNWTSGNTSVATIGSTNGAATGVAPGTSLISYTVNGCSRSRNITVNPIPAAIGGSSAVCVGSTITLTNTTPGGTWSSSAPTFASIGLTTGVVTGMSFGTTTISYRLSTGCNTTKVVSVNIPPSAITGPGAVCTGSTITLSNSVSGGGWTCLPSTVATINSGGALTGVGAGVATVTYSITGCSSTFRSVTVNATPVLTGPTTVCTGSTITLTPSPGGGAWTSSNSSIAAVGSTSGIVTGVSAGAANISYSVAGCSTSRPVTVQSAPAPITGPGSLCAGSIITLSDPTAGGSWSSSNPAVATIGSTGIVTGNSAGFAIISYTMSGCGSVIHTLAVNPSPTAISGSSTVCVGSTTSLTNGAIGGVWNSSNPSIATVNSAGVVTGSAPGVVTISYSIGSCGPAVKSVTVAPLPTLSGGSTVCAGSTLFLTPSIGGGTWSSSNTAVAAAGSSGVTGISAGTATITYTLSTGCKAFKVVSVTPAPSAITGSSPVCAGSSITLTNATSGGVWSSSDTSKATVNAAGVVTGISAGTAVISYSIPGCSSATTIVSVNALPAPIAGSGVVCSGSTLMLTNSIAGGSWSTSDATVASVDASGTVTGIAPGTATIYYTLPTGCATSTVVTVNLTPAAITGSSVLCTGNSTTLADATAGGTWSSSNASVASVSPAGVVTGMGAGTATIYYTIGGCSTSFTITVNTPPATISGASLVCVGSTISLANTIGGGTWSSSNTSVATVNASGVVSGVTSGTVNIYYVTGGCGTYKIVTVTTTPAPISGAGTVCLGSTITLSNAVPGGSWSSSGPAIASVGATSGIVTGLNTGAITISYAIPGCGTVSKVITVTPGPGVIGGSSIICVGSVIVLTNPTSGGIWSTGNPTLATINATSGMVNALAAGVVNMYYTAGACSVSKTLTINAMPPAITGSSSVCIGSATTFADASTGGTWSSANTSIATVNVSTGVVTGVGVGSANINYSKGGCVISKSITVVNIAPPIAGSGAVCVGSTISLSNTLTGGAWSSAMPSRATVNATSGIVTGVSAGIVSIYYTVGSCSASKIITVNPAPSAISGNATLCVGTSTAFFNATAGGTWSSSNTSIASVNVAGIVTGVAPGTATISYTKGGCSATKIVTISACGARTDPYTTSTSEISEAGKINIYPNPASDVLFIQWEGQAMAGATIMISDVAGREVSHTVIANSNANGTHQIVLPAMANGVYLVTIKSGQVNYKSRVLISK